MYSVDYHREHFVPEQPPSRAATIAVSIALTIITLSSIGLVVVGTNPEAAELVYNSELWQMLSAKYQALWCYVGRCS